MTEARRDFLAWTTCLLDPAATFGEQREAANQWYSWALARLGYDESRLSLQYSPFEVHTRLPTGKAISPLSAARCVREYRRTAVFLQGMDAALRAIQERFPGEAIHVVEAGCGPLAPLSLPFAVRYPPEQVRFTLLDLHPVSLDAARRLAEALDAGASIRAYLAEDATAVRLDDRARPHLIACEMLLRALTSEPQVAATLNLAPQLLPGGFFLPEQIDVDAALFDHGKHLRLSQAGSTETGSVAWELGRVFRLEAMRAGELRRETPDHISAGSIAVPRHDARRTPLRLLTRIRIFGTHRLDDFDSSLNLPQQVKYPPALAESGGTAEFVYTLSAEPGLRLRRES